MKTASMVLGIVGGVLTILAAIAFIVVGAFAQPAATYFEEHIGDLEGIKIEEDGEIIFSHDGEKIGFFDEDGTSVYVDHDFFRGFSRHWGSFGSGIFRAVFWVIGFMNLVGGVLGLVGGAIVKRSNTTGGVLMLVAAFIGFVGFALFLVGGILALVKEKNPVQPPQATV